MLCDLTVAKIILEFSIGGVTLRGIIALIKKMLKIEGFLASALALGCSFVATGIYLVVTANFSPVCLVIIGFTVYGGSQATYSLTKKKEPILP